MVKMFHSPTRYWLITRARGYIIHMIPSFWTSLPTIDSHHGSLSQIGLSSTPLSFTVISLNQVVMFLSVLQTGGKL